MPCNIFSKMRDRKPKDLEKNATFEKFETDSIFDDLESNATFDDLESNATFDDLEKNATRDVLTPPLPQVKLPEQKQPLSPGSFPTIQYITTPIPPQVAAKAGEILGIPPQICSEEREMRLLKYKEGPEEWEEPGTSDYHMIISQRAAGVNKSSCGSFPPIQYITTPIPAQVAAKAGKVLGIPPQFWSEAKDIGVLNDRQEADDWEVPGPPDYHMISSERMAEIEKS